MKSKLRLAVALLGLAVAPASAQQVSTPALNAIAGAYNGTTYPNITAGKFGLVQVDSRGNLVVSCTNCGAASITGINVNGPFNVTVTNNATGPVIVSSPSGFGTSGSAVSATITNTANVSIVNQTYAPQGVTVLNNVASPAIVSVANTPASPVNVSIVNTPLVVTTANTPQLVTCTNCGAASISSVTVTNTSSNPVGTSERNSTAILAAIQAAVPAGTNAIGIVSVTNILGALPSGANTLGQVTCLNCTGSAGPFNVTVTNVLSNVTVQNANSSAPIFNRPVAGTVGGWTLILLNGLTTTKTTIKNASGQLAKLYCYNPNSSVAYVQVFDALTGSVTLGTTSPKNSYGIPATSAAGFALADVGDQYATAISVAATTTVAGLTAPSTALDCNASYN